MEDNFEVIENIYQDISTILDNEEYIKEIKRGLNRITSKELCIKIIFKAYFYLQRMNQSKKINKLFKYLARLDDSTKYFVIYYNQFNKEYNQRKLLKLYIIVLMKEARKKKRSLENLKELLIPCLLMKKSENKNVDKNIDIKNNKNNNNNSGDTEDVHKDDKENNKKMQSIANDLQRYIKSIKVKEKDSEIQREFIQTRFTLGDGGTSKVYLGFDVDKERGDAQMVAIKKFRPEVRERAMEESELLCEKRNKKISNLIAHGIIDEKDTYVQVMDYICGFDLETFLEKKGIPETKAKEIFSKIVQTLYDLGVSHRDLKPANIMLRFDHSVVLIDFTMFSKNDINKSIVGTPKYIAPEVKYERAYDPEKADVWSLGIILFEMIFGISKMGFDLESLETKNISSSLKSLLRQMLNENFPERISLAEILNSPWLTTEEEVEKLENEIEYIKIMTEKTVQLVKENFVENDHIDFEFLDDSISSISLDPFSPDVFDGNYDLINEISSDLHHLNDLRLQKQDLLQFSPPSTTPSNEDVLIIKELNLLFQHHLHLVKVIDQNFVIKKDLVLLRFNQLFLFCNIKLGQFFLSIKEFKQDISDEDYLSRLSKLKKKLTVIKEIFGHLSSVLLYFFDRN